MTARTPTPGEELASSLSHGAGLLAGLAALPVLVSAARPDPWQVAGGAVFGAMLVVLYLASTVYHALPPSPRKAVARRLDHAAIYLLIAGTYTPFTLGALRGPLGWALLAVVWGLAAVGVAVKLRRGVADGVPRLSTALYLAMGWLVVVALRPLAEAVGPAGLAWLLAGGVCYTAGVAFYAWERLRYGHLVWHLFVLAGSTCHFFAVLWHAD